MRNTVVVFVVALLIVVTIVALATIPVGHSFSQNFGGSAYSLSNATIDPPKGSHESGTYTVTGWNGGMPFFILDSNHDLVYNNTHTSGSFSFTSENPAYLFGSVSGNVSVSGTILYPVI